MAWPARKIGTRSCGRLAGGCLSGQAFVVSAIHPILPGVFTYGVTQVQAGGREHPLAWPARKQDIMRLTQRAVILVTAAVALLAPVAAMATAASASPAMSAARVVTAAIRVTATVPVGTTPLGVAANPRTNTIYVTNATDHTVSLIRRRTNTVTPTIPVCL